MLSVAHARATVYASAPQPGIGQYNYTVPEQALPILQKFQRPLVNPPILPKAA